MIEIDVPSLKEHDTGNARRIAAGIREIRTLDELGRWDKQATDEVHNIRLAVQAIEAKLQQAARAIELAREVHERKGFFARLFSNRTEENKARAHREDLFGEKARLERLADQLQSAVDFTPDSAGDLVALLKEFRARKKELQAEKRAVGAEMAQIRVEARQKTANTMPGKYGKWERRYLRLEKEKALGPQESQKAGLERQIIELDRVVAWLERFK